MILGSAQKLLMARAGASLDTTGASIVTDGLILHLDAGDSASYPGTGTTWTDLSGNSNDFTLDNASAYNSTGPKYMDFNGSYGMAYISPDLSVSGDVTYVLATRIKNSTGDWRTLTRASTSGADHHVIVESGSYDLGMYDNDGTQFQDSGYDQTSFPNHGTTDWMLLYFRWNSGGGYEMSYNDTPGTIRADMSGNSNAAYQHGFYTLGGYNRSSQYWGDIGIFLVYDRYLSDAELTQNFNALKDRYGLSSTPATSTFIDTYLLNTSTTTYNFTTASISPSLVVVAVHNESNSGTIPATGVTIGGVSATEAVTSTSVGASTEAHVSIWYAVIDSSTTSISVSHGSSPLRCGIGVYTIQDYNSTTPVFTGSDTDSTYVTTRTVNTTSISPGSVIIAGHTSADQYAHTWSGVTERYDVSIGSFTGATGASLDTSLNKTHTITTTVGATPTQGTALAVAVWE